MEVSIQNRNSILGWVGFLAVSFIAYLAFATVYHWPLALAETGIGLKAMLGGTLIIGGTRGAIELIKTKQILIIVLFTLIGASVGTVLTSTLTPLWVYRGTVMGAIIGLFVFAILQGLADAASRQH